LGTATKDNANGEFPERSKGSDCKSDGTAFAGSNPALPTCPTADDLAEGDETSGHQNRL